MDSSYRPLYDQVRNLEFDVKDALDNPSHASAQALRSELTHLEDDMERSLHPRDLENRIKKIQQLLLQARSQHGSYMSVGDADAFYGRFEAMRRAVRAHPRY